MALYSLTHLLSAGLRIGSPRVSIPSPRLLPCCLMALGELMTCQVRVHSGTTGPLKCAPFGHLSWCCALTESFKREAS